MRRIGLLLLSILILGTLTVAASHFFNPPENKQPVQTVTVSEKPPTLDNRLNILLLGLDDGTYEDSTSARRSDAMLVASIDPEHKSVELLSIPRDSRVSIPGYDGMDKITHAFFYGGADLSVRTVEKLLNIPIHYYVVIDWQAFIKVIDILGGINIDVEENMNYDDPYEDLHIHLTKGYQHLNGEQAGEYVRFRHDELGDIGRVQRQQHFLSALTDQLLQSGTILKLPSLLSTINQYIKTDMSLYTMLKIANTLKSLQLGSVHTAMLPGDFATIDNISYWIPNISQTRK